MRGAGRSGTERARRRVCSIPPSQLLSPAWMSWSFSSIPVFGPLWNGKGKPNGSLMISCVSLARDATLVPPPQAPADTALSGPCRQLLQQHPGTGSLAWLPLAAALLCARVTQDTGAGFVLLSCFSLHWEQQWGAQGPAQCAAAVSCHPEPVFLQPHWCEPSLGFGEHF